MLIYSLFEPEQQEVEFHLEALVTGNSEKTNIPNIIKIRDMTHATTGRLMLTSVIYI